MLDDGAKEKGYVLLCVATPEEDCEVQAIEEVSWTAHPSQCMPLRGLAGHVT